MGSPDFSSAAMMANDEQLAAMMQAAMNSGGRMPANFQPSHNKRSKRSVRTPKNTMSHQNQNLFSQNVLEKLTQQKLEQFFNENSNNMSPEQFAALFAQMTDLN